MAIPVHTDVIINLKPCRAPALCPSSALMAASRVCLSSSSSTKLQTVAVRKLLYGKDVKVYKATEHARCNV